MEPENKKRWEIVDEATKLASDETATEHVRTLAAGLKALREIVSSHLANAGRDNIYRRINADLLE